jgi:hypothetical protein
MTWGRTTAQLGWLAALLALWVVLLAGGRAAARTWAEETYDISPLGTDPARQVDRYQITLGPGASLWELGFNRLPLVAIEQGDSKVVETVEQAFRAQYPDRGPELVRPGDNFILEVPTGTFVSKVVDHQPDRVVFTSISGDELTTFPKDPIVQYRLRHADTPDKVEVAVQGGQADPADEAKKIYDIDQPDFLQVRTVRGALQERTSKITVDVNRHYLDDFRAVRDKATRVEDQPSGLKSYFFDQDDQDIPFVRVDDAVGDQTDPANFPRTFRIAYYRDGTVRKYIITEPGDSTGALGQPDSEIWRRTLSNYQEWLAGQPEALPPFAPAISNSGSLQPGRILVLAFRPRTTPPSPHPAGAATAKGSGLDCLGVPLGMVLLGGVLAMRRRRPAA